MSTFTDACTIRAMVRSMAVLLVVLFAAVALHEYRLFSVQEALHRAQTLDVITTRVAVIAADLQGYSIAGLGNVRALVTALELAPRMREPEAAFYQRELDRFAEEHRSFYFARYIPEQGTPVHAGEDVIPSAGEPESPFTELAELARLPGSDEVMASGLVERRSPAGARTPIIYLLVEATSPERQNGRLELALDLTPLFGIVRESARPDERLMLLDGDGKYLVATGGERGPDALFREDYPSQVADAIFGDKTAGTFAYGGEIFVFRHVMVPGVRTGIAPDRYWVLVSAASGPAAFFDNDYIARERWLSFGLFSILILALAGFLLALRRKLPLMP